MAIFDGVVLVVLILAIVHGRFKGMALQLAPIASLVLGYVVAFPLAPQLAPWFGDSAPMNFVLALLVLYLAVALGVYLIARSLKEYIIKFKLEEYDKHLGALFGGVKGLIFCLMMTFFSVALSANAREYIQDTHTGYAAAHIMDALHPAMPEELHDKLEPYIHSLDQDHMDLDHRHDHAEEPHHQGEQFASKSEQQPILQPFPESGVFHGPHEEFPHAHDDHVEPASAEQKSGVDNSNKQPSREEKVVDGVLKILDILTDQ